MGMFIILLYALMAGAVSILIGVYVNLTAQLIALPFLIIGAFFVGQIASGVDS